MRVKRDAAYEAFLSALDSHEDEPGMTRIKHVRDRPLMPGGRTQLTLFEAVGGGRPHPRLQVSMPPAVDPSPPRRLYHPPEAPPRTADALRAHLAEAIADVAGALVPVDMDAAPAGSERYFVLSVRAQRIAQLFGEVRAAVDGWLASGALPGRERTAAMRAIRELEDDTYAADMQFDDADTGTYHSYGHDAPFVHYLEAMLGSLPEDGGEAMAALPAEAQESVRRQRDQLRAHLDYLMRHKYAYQLIDETDIERTLGGFLIDRETRLIVSEARDEASLVPRFELLRVDPGADHPHAGAYVYRDSAGALHLQDHAPVTVDDGQLRSISREPTALTFRRAPRDRHLRSGVRFDWDGNGWVQAGPIEWVSWAGHCDIKAIMEQLGIALLDEPSVTEHRSDTGQVVVYSRDLLLEMIASVLELGSLYRRADGTGHVMRGIRRFGGARNDSRPDRLQLQGFGPGRSFRWPMGGRQDQMRVLSIEWGGVKADMDTVFFRNIPDLEAVDFAPNPRFIKTVEGDYNLIDVSGAVIAADVLIDSFDQDTGYPVQRRQRIAIDLRTPWRARRGEADGRYFLGTHIDDVATRRMYRVYLDRVHNQIVAEMEVFERRDGKWRATPRPEENQAIPLVEPLSCTLSREMKRDEPEAFQTLLDVAVRSAQNICADTDMKAEVWNGVVTRLAVAKLGENPARRVQRWSVDITARFGAAKLDYLVRRDEAGEPVEYCPAPGDGDHERWPDFLWQDFPDVGSKGFEGADWIVNDAMLERGIVTMRVEPGTPGGFYVYDDHIKNVYELIYAGLAGYTHTIVHANKRYGFTGEAAWRRAIDTLDTARAKLSFENS